MSVLGKTHPEVVQMFQSIPINQYVDMVLCRGYPLPPDVDLDSDDPLPPPPLPPATGEVVTAVPLINGQPLLVKGDVLHGSSQELHYVTLDASGRPVVAAIPNGRQGERGEVATTMLQPELVSVPLVKGPGGFGFAIADCPLGQKVKMILDAQWCRGLQKGDVIKEINRQNVQTLSHAQVVDILKDLPVGSEVNVLVLRGGESFSLPLLISLSNVVPPSFILMPYLVPTQFAIAVNAVPTVPFGGEVSVLILTGGEVVMWLFGGHVLSAHCGI